MLWGHPLYELSLTSQSTYRVSRTYNGLFVRLGDPGIAYVFRVSIIINISRLIMMYSLRYKKNIYINLGTNIYLHYLQHFYGNILNTITLHVSYVVTRLVLDMGCFNQFTHIKTINVIKHKLKSIKYQKELSRRSLQNVARKLLGSCNNKVATIFSFDYSTFLILYCT